MTSQTFSGLLNAATWPLVSLFQSRTVVQPQLDLNVRNPRSFYGTQESVNYQLPQLLYCENVVPTGEGLTSVGYSQVIARLPGVSSFDQAITLRDANENNFLLVPANGANYIYKGNVGAWVSTNPVTLLTTKISRAYVNGRTFVCYAGLGIYEYNTGTGVFALVALTGLTATAIKGIGSSSNYLLAYDGITLYWSSLIDPTDFTPSIVTGAGFSTPQDVKSDVTAVVGTSGGFIAYTSKNAVAAVFTNNIRAPFSFKEIANAGGLESYEQVTSDQSSGAQYAWTTGGLQKITLQGAEPVAGEVSDFLSGRIWEYWDSSQKKLIPQLLAANEFDVKLSYVGSRMLVISYSYTGNGVYQYALLYDVVLKRWGKVKIDHVDCFQHPYPNVFGDLSYSDLSTISYEDLGDTSYTGLATGIVSPSPSRRSMAFLGVDGAVNIALFDYNKQNQRGILVLGKFQLVRSRRISLEYVEFEGVMDDNPETVVTLLTSWDGKNQDVSDSMILTKARSNYRRYARRTTGENFSFALEGTFALSSYHMRVTAEGDR